MTETETHVYNGQTYEFVYNVTRAKFTGDYLQPPDPDEYELLEVLWNGIEVMDLLKSIDENLLDKITK